MIPDETRGQLRFRFADLIQEIGALKELAAPFVDSRSAAVLRQMSDDLEGIWSAAPDRPVRWELGDLWTVISEGEYEPGTRKGSRRVVACISGTWDVCPLGPNAKKSKEREQRLLEFCGIASTRVRLFDSADTVQQLSMWRTELGDARSPGCHFHVQVLGEVEEVPFPRSVSIPRLPTIFVTPMGAIEFTLGELFQDRWAKAAMEDTGSGRRWASFQKHRLLSLLDWQRKEVKDALTSPWMALKRAKPAGGLFLS